MQFTRPFALRVLPTLLPSHWTAFDPHGQLWNIRPSPRLVTDGHRYMNPRRRSAWTRRGTAAFTKTQNSRPPLPSRGRLAFPEQGHLVRRPATLRAWLTAYAAATGTTASYNSILEAATPGDGDKPAKTTTIAYRDVLSQIWLLDPVPGWLPVRNHFTRLAQSPKHYLVDPALAARLLGATSRSLLVGEPSRPYHVTALCLARSSSRLSL